MNGSNNFDQISDDREFSGDSKNGQFPTEDIANKNNKHTKLFGKSQNTPFAGFSSQSRFSPFLPNNSNGISQKEYQKCIKHYPWVEKIFANQTGQLNVNPNFVKNEKPVIKGKFTLTADFSETKFSDAIFEPGIDLKVLKCNATGDVEIHDYHWDKATKITNQNSTPIEDENNDLNQEDEEMVELIEENVKLFGFSGINVHENNLPEEGENETEVATDANELIKHNQNNDFNILLLGETGTGKSTTINAIANYLKFPTFEEAKMSEFVELIPSKFSLCHPDTNEMIKIESGKEPNEDFKDGASRTQAPRGYFFETKQNQKIQIIDTPGMGDTRGLEVDKENFEKILNFLNQPNQLHGICILLNSTVTRTNAAFRYCITELLANLHMSACKNIYFCFTFARNALFGPGDGFYTLETFLQTELPETRIDLSNEHRCFYIDNEAYRFLVAKKQNFPFDEGQEETFKESWIKSASGVNTMIETVMQVEPHDLTHTKMLNHTKKIVLQLAEPILLMQQVIEINIQQFKKYIVKLNNFSRSGKLDRIEMIFKIIDLEINNLPVPKVVCISSSCENSDCHVGCVEVKILGNSIGSYRLNNCSKMKQDACTVCSCHWKEHMYVITDHKENKVDRRVYVQNNVKKNSKNGPEIYSPQNLINSLNECLETFAKNLETIRDVTAKIGYLLKKNSNGSFASFIEPYLDKQINEEKQNVKYTENYPLDKLQKLEELKRDYQKRVKNLETSQSKFELDQIPYLRKKLSCFKLFKPLLENFDNFIRQEAEFSMQT